MKALIKSFGYAFCGIGFAIRTQRNMRIHLVVCLYMFGILLFGGFFEVSRTQYAILFLTNALVMMGELVNTAIESVVDLVEQKKNAYCKAAKDAAAGAVLIAAIFAVLTGIVILWQPEAFLSMFRYFRTHLWAVAVLLLSLVISTIFVFYPEKKGSHS